MCFLESLASAQYIMTFIAIVEQSMYEAALCEWHFLGLYQLSPADVACSSGPSKAPQAACACMHGDIVESFGDSHAQQRPRRAHDQSGHSCVA